MFWSCFLFFYTRSCLSLNLLLFRQVEVLAWLYTCLRCRLTTRRQPTPRPQHHHCLLRFAPCRALENHVRASETLRPSTPLHKVHLSFRTKAPEPITPSPSHSSTVFPGRATHKRRASSNAHIPSRPLPRQDHRAHGWRTDVQHGIDKPSAIRPDKKAAERQPARAVPCIALSLCGERAKKK